MAHYNWIATALLCFAPIVCPAQESDPFSFPLPLSLDVGDRWTYSIVKVHWKAEQDTTTNTFGIFDTLSTETLTLRVVERLPMEDQTYFALSDGSLYRVDEAGRTWRYDTEAKSETIVWDIWRPIVWQVWIGPSYIPWIERPVVVDGYACEYDGCLSRYGPFVRYVFDERDFWITTINTDTGTLSQSIRDFIYYPDAWTYADILKLPAWNVTELYVFEDTSSDSDGSVTMTIVVAPNVGVVYYAFAEYFYSPYDDEYESMDRADSTGAGKVGVVNDEPPGILNIETTAWVLQDVQKGDPKSTVVEDTSWGQLKQRTTRPAPHAP